MGQRSSSGEMRMNPWYRIQWAGVRAQLELVCHREQGSHHGGILADALGEGRVD